MLIDAILDGRLETEMGNLKWKLDKSYLSPGYINNFSEITLNKSALIPFANTQKSIPEFLKAGNKKFSQDGQTKGMIESMQAAVTAAFLLGKDVERNGIIPGNLTSKAVQEFLGANGFGYGENKTFQIVWKAIPHSQKSAGGRPPKE